MLSSSVYKVPVKSESSKMPLDPGSPSPPSNYCDFEGFAVSAAPNSLLQEHLLRKPRKKRRPCHYLPSTGVYAAESAPVPAPAPAPVVPSPAPPDSKNVLERMNLETVSGGGGGGGGGAGAGAGAVAGAAPAVDCVAGAGGAADAGADANMEQSVGSPQQFCLRWNNYTSNLTNVFDQLLQSESFVDVTLACEGHTVKAHKMVLSACSPYFQALFFDNPCKHPIVILKDIHWPDLKAAVEFMYKGEINVSQEQIAPLLQVAEALKIRGLAEVNGEQDADGRGKVWEPVRGEAALTSAAPAALASATLRDPGSAASSPRGVSTSPLSHRPKKRSRMSADQSPSHSSSPDNTATPPLPMSSASTPAPMGRPSASSTPSEPLDGGGGGAPGGMGRPVGQRPAQTSPASQLLPPPPPPPPAASNSMSMAEQNLALSLSMPSLLHSDDMEIRPGIAEMIREEERAKLLESSHSWFGASSTSIAEPHLVKVKTPPWTQSQLRDAIQAVVTQKMRFTQAAVRFGIPKGTLYDNILGKSRRMAVLDLIGLTPEEDEAVIDFCCDRLVNPHSRRTKMSLRMILTFVEGLKGRRDPGFAFEGLVGFRWWWAFCKKYNIASLYDDMAKKPVPENGW